MSWSRSAPGAISNGDGSWMPAENSIAEVPMSEELLTTAAVRRLAGELVSDELVVMPVRHHSPACALQVRQVIAERRPSVVLVEGPRGFDGLIPLLTHAEARMPLAVYTYAHRGAGEEQARWSAYYPFCDYSPELVALKAAAEQGIPARFIDLDLAEQQPQDEAGSLLEEHHFRHSASLRLLTERLGCRDVEDLWELLFEADAGSASTDEHVARVAAYCALARADYSAEDLAADGTAAREAEMVWHIRAALAERVPGDGPILVVLGGFHAVAIPALLADPPARPELPTDGITGDSALIRFSFERLERLNGYAAGMTSPAWHQHLWEGLVGGPTDEEPRTAALLTALLDISRDLRVDQQLPLSVASVAAAFEQALQLAELRNHPAPLRSDLLDAVTSCFVKGDIDIEGLRISAACRRILTGDAIGTVPPGTGTPPLVHDAFERLHRQRLKVDSAGRQTTSLDIYRSAAHRETSRLLHGLSLLSVPFATKVAGPDFVRGFGLGRLQERWDYGWSPLTEGALVEASVYGSTLPAAVLAKFSRVLAEHRDSSRRSDAIAAVALLSQACVLGLQTEVPKTLDLVRSTIVEDASFTNVATATTRLALLWEAREPLEARLVDDLPVLLRAAYGRGIYLGRELQGGREDEAAEIVNALVQFRELIASQAGAELDGDLYWELIARLHTEYDVPLVRGAATGLLYSAGRIGSGELVERVSGHLAGGVAPTEAVGFLTGLLITARETAWQENELLAGLDRRLAEWKEETFVAHLPELRLAFADLTPMETDRVASAVAKLHGRSDLGSLVQRNVSDSEVQHNLEISVQVAALLARDGLAAWSES
ncbi:DUF5682 family protein [Kribbella sp. NPDC056861]|uniref:DUF5682 family protein n=1 Tax=Kribbella sp. NPDC056861 TaxID=3154857 RepID=UPI00342478A3